MEEQIYNFKCTFVKEVYKDVLRGFNISGVNVDTGKYPFIIKNRYGNVTIKGQFHRLKYGRTYYVTATKDVSDKYGVSYNVLLIKDKLDVTEEETLVFLQTIGTDNQAKQMFEKYPDIVERVFDNNLGDVNPEGMKWVTEDVMANLLKKINNHIYLFDTYNIFYDLLSEKLLRKLVEINKDLSYVKKSLYEDPYNILLGIKGVGFLTADMRLLSMQAKIKERIAKGEEPNFNFKEELLTSKCRCMACIDYFLKKNHEEGHTNKHIEELRSDVNSCCPEAFFHFDEIIKSNKYAIVDDFLCFREIYDKENYIACKIAQAFEINKTKYNWEVGKVTKVQDFDLTDKQISLQQMVRDNPVVILQGPAGSGKSSSVRALIETLEKNNVTFIQMTPTGKSAKVLREYTKREASTIHRALGITKENRHGKLYDITQQVIIIDECSMINLDLMCVVLEKIDFKKNKLLLIGDPYQLPSIGCGAVYGDLADSGVVPCINLDKIFRYGESGILTVATDTRNQKPFLPETLKDGRCTLGNSYTFSEVDSKKIAERVVQYYKGALNRGAEPKDIIVITPTNKNSNGTIKINNMIQKAINPRKGEDTYLSTTIDKIPVEFRLNDIVLNTVNNYQSMICDQYGYITLTAGRYMGEHVDYKRLLEILEEEAAEIEDGSDLGFPEKIKKTEFQETLITNGETGRIVRVLPWGLVVKYDENYILVRNFELSNLNLGYCITAHKSQGSGYKIVILITLSEHFIINNNALLYTALTRAKNVIIHLGSKDAVNSLVRNAYKEKRMTNLKQLIQKSKEESNYEGIDKYLLRLPEGQK